MIEIGQRCKGIVVRKDEKSKELWIHLTKLIISEPESKYITTERTSNKLR